MTDHTYDTILSAMTGEGVRTISLNRPHALNAMNRQLVEDAAAAFEDANRDAGTRAIIFTGEGRAFCAGDDRREHVHPATEDEAREIVQAIQRVTEAIVFGQKPVVGAINGWAVGGGFEWAINCDFPIWAEGARAFFPEVSLNVFVTGAVTALLPAIVGPVKAREMLYLGERYSARDLEACGIASRVVPGASLREEAGRVASTLAALPPSSVGRMKRVLAGVAAESVRAALRLETEATVAAFLDPDASRRIGASY